MWRADSLEMILMLHKDGRKEEMGATEGEIVGWHHQLNGLEFEQIPGYGDGRGGLAFCSPWGQRESNMT